MKLLVVDDEPGIRESLRLNLEREGFVVTTAEDGAAGLDLLRAGRFDCALCDLVMPRLSGLELIEAATSEELPTPIVAMSAHADMDTALEAVRRGAADFVPKGSKVPEILFRLRKVLAQHKLEEEVSRLKEVLAEETAFDGIISRSKEMQAVFRTVRKVADYKTTVLLQGESGTGKELVARALHFNGVRRDAPFVAVNCGAIPEALLESELFGHVRGAFTDASRDRRGLFEAADGGTLFLDEVGELPLALQVKMLRVLQEGEIRRVGDSKPHPVDVRVVAATVRDLAAEVKAGNFREDLYYRLNVLNVQLPPLRERGGDVPILVEHFIARFNERLGTSIAGIDADAQKLLVQYQWPGNVRELENAIERAIVLSTGDRITIDDLAPRIRESQDPIRQTLASGELSIKKTTRIIEEELIRRALTRTGGNRTRAAELLEISHRALLYKIKDYAVDL